VIDMASTAVQLFTGTAQGGSANTIILQNGETNYPVGRIISVGGYEARCASVTGWGTATPTANIDGTWPNGFVPAAGNGYNINDLVPYVDGSGRVDLGRILGTASAGVAGYVGVDWAHINAPTTTVALSGTTLANVTVGGYASGQDPATLVLDVAASSHNTAGTIGHDINAAGTASDPWATVLPGSYAAGTAGSIIGNRLDTAVSTRSTYAGADTPGTTTLLSRIPATLTTANIATAVMSDVTDTVGATIVSMNSNVTTLLSRIPSALTIASGKVAATVATGDGADAASMLALGLSWAVPSDHTQLTAHAVALAPSGGGGGLTLGSILNACPDFTSRPDASMTVSDGLWAAIVGIGGNDVSTGTSQVMKTPAGTTARTSTVTVGNNPFGGNNVPTKRT
jgi:hypothetical protein